MPALLASPYHATSQNPQDSEISFSVIHGWSAFGGADHGQAAEPRSACTHPVVSIRLVQNIRQVSFILSDFSIM
jgi:hypothetical protein